VVAAILAAVVVYAVIDEDSGIPRQCQVRADVAAADERGASLGAEIAELEREAAALETDPFAVERAIRSDLELVMPGERVVRSRPENGSNPRFP